jgi:cytochrome bd-type quinol oxidase subunit 1
MADTDQPYTAFTIYTIITHHRMTVYEVEVVIPATQCPPTPTCPEFPGQVQLLAACAVFFAVYTSLLIVVVWFLARAEKKYEVNKLEEEKLEEKSKRVVVNAEGPAVTV